MKNLFPLLITFFISSICFGQWTGVGQPIYGEYENDYTGTSVSLSGAGDRVAVLDVFVDLDARGRVRVFELQNNNWVQLGDGVVGLIGDGTGGGNVVISDDGNRFVFGSPLHNANGDYSGAVRVFEFQNGNWEQMGATLFGAEEHDEFGQAVDIDSNGETIIIGAHQDPWNSGPGYARVYQYQNGDWEQKGLDISGEAKDDQAGSSVNISFDGNRILIAAPGNSGNGPFSGEVKVFSFQGNDWVQLGNSIYGEEEGDILGSTVV